MSDFKHMVKLLEKVGLIILIACLFSVGIDAAYRHAYALNYQFPHLFIHPDIAQPYEIVSVGNSHAEDGIRFERYNLRSLRLASVAQSYDYDLANLKMYSRQIGEGAVIIINASPISFSQKKSGKQDSLQYKYYDGRLSPFLIPDIKVGDYLQSQIFPFLRAGYLLREKHAQEVEARIAAELKGPGKSTVVAATPSGEIKKHQTWVLSVKPEDYFFNVEAIRIELTSSPSTPAASVGESARVTVDRWYHSAGFGTEYFDTNRRDLEKLITYCLKKKWRPVLISIPVSQVLLDALPKNHLENYVYSHLARARLQGISYLDFSAERQLTTDGRLFGNADHLNPEGAAIFSYLLLRQLIDRGYVPASADGYDYGPLYVYQD